MASLDLVKTIRNYEYEDFSYAVKEWSPPYIGCNLNSFFTRMREPQLMTWSLEVLESYCADLERAKTYHTSLFIERFVYVYGCSKRVPGCNFRFLQSGWDLLSWKRIHKGIRRMKYVFELNL